LLEEVAPGLRRWSALHPDWTPEEGGPDGWDQEVACTAWAADDGLVLIDPLVPAGDREQQALWSELDTIASTLDCPVDVVLTVHWHERSAGEVFERYSKTLGCRIWVHERGAERVACPVTDSFTGDSRLPGGVEPLEVERADEVLLWLGQRRALVAGDVLLGDGGGLRLCPADWVGGEANLDEVRAALQRLMTLPAEMVLVSHGPPVLSEGRHALEAALTEP
jgi:glyoxylase-like metal-dependent hydrolase (beta-lactamase superfamily II)